ncbi:conserved hypothetical protein [Perkinsus marinus ATCC 50983]|uniref:DUF4954 domain-containing protein n=1 Tax=Perkinsus marinus (strain ATCC 50983 / TXsc) TaxID=423536 RepID=C5LJA7_PERM5|nr:conserved hypothetical protein [Perkinsus marinus ATCC 50983]EER03223.1 conserved hypothetical protein [Perkinsus marinus ATCC 50983]|eukprot:XP_002771407.1 conserved hypothetical protein [Perkinsus marinus ATCC 50983]
MAPTSSTRAAASFSSGSTPADFVKECITRSSFVGALREANTLRRLRPLTADEIAALQGSGCTAEDWGEIMVIGDSPLAVGKIRGCTFQGRIELAVEEGSKVSIGDSRRQLPCGIVNSFLEDVTVESGTLVKDCGLVANTVVRRGAVLVRCSVVEGSTESHCKYGNGHSMSLAEETGSRRTRQFAELTIEIAAKVVSNRKESDAYHAAVDAYVDAVEDAGQGRTIIDENAEVISCCSIKGSYIGRHVRVVNSRVHNSSLLDFNIVEDCSLNTAILQKSASVATFGVVEGSVLCPTVHVERHGKVFDSIIGPGSGVAEGEVTASLVGPFVGFHHQALLIACFWPAGRGNVGHGANVGSNHTGKAPDQENWPGEGTFFGLASNIKYPFHLVDAPYSLIATGVSCLPQAIGLPFSLVNESSEYINGLSPAINEITPGWMLSDNMYSLFRNEAKFESRQRNLSKDGVMYQFAVFRPEIMDRVVKARDALKAADPKDAKLKDAKGRAVFTDKEIPIMGKNWMNDSTRLIAIKTYSTFLQWYAIRGLWRRLASIHFESGHACSDEAAKLVSSTIAYLKSPPVVDLSPVYENLTACAFTDEASQAELRELQWAHECKVLRTECEDPLNVAALLRWFGETNQEIAQSCITAKARDDARGARIIGNSFTEAHESAEENQVCKNAVAEANRVEEEIENFLATSKLWELMRHQL